MRISKLPNHTFLKNYQIILSLSSEINLVIKHNLQFQKIMGAIKKNENILKWVFATWTLDLELCLYGFGFWMCWMSNTM